MTMLKVIRVVWPVLGVVLVLFTMWICLDNPVPMVELREGDEISVVQAVGIRPRAELWLSALPMLTTFVITTAGVAFGASPVKRLTEAAQTRVAAKATGAPQGIVG